ncbi:MAG: hypothetical protein Q8R78_02695, partial [Candidatus Omnitrophota bacterium]|nr:hypothetical protein [Candidatus Omnitrophota bacterium]
TVIRAVRLKGTGWRERNGPWQPPAMESYTGPGRTQQVWRVAPDGQLSSVASEDRPMGAMFLQRAQREFRMTHAAFHDGLPVNVPVGYGEFTRMSFHGGRLGFVILGIADARDQRLNDEWTQQWYLPRRWEAHRQWLADYYLEQARRLGALLRWWHRAGYLHEFPHLGNVSLAEHTEVLHDLDHATRIDRLTDAQRLALRLVDLDQLANGSSGVQGWANLWATPAGGRPEVRDAMMRAVLEGYFGPHDEPAQLTAEEITQLALQLHQAKPIVELDSPLIDLMKAALKEDGQDGLGQESPAVEQGRGTTDLALFVGVAFALEGLLWLLGGWITAVVGLPILALIVMVYRLDVLPRRERLRIEAARQQARQERSVSKSVPDTKRVADADKDEAFVNEAKRWAGEATNPHLTRAQARAALIRAMEFADVFLAEEMEWQVRSVKSTERKI